MISGPLVITYTQQKSSSMINTITGKLFLAAKIPFPERPFRLSLSQCSLSLSYGMYPVSLISLLLPSLSSSSSSRLTHYIILILIIIIQLSGVLRALSLYRPIEGYALSLSLSLLLFRPGMDTVIQLIQEEQQREATEVFNLVHEMAKDGGK